MTITIVAYVAIVNVVITTVTLYITIHYDECDVDRSVDEFVDGGLWCGNRDGGGDGNRDPVVWRLQLRS